MVVIMFAASLALLDVSFVRSCFQFVTVMQGQSFIRAKISSFIGFSLHDFVVAVEVALPNVLNLSIMIMLPIPFFRILYNAFMIVSNLTWSLLPTCMVPKILSQVTDEEFHQMYSLFFNYGGSVKFIDECKQAIGFQVVIYYQDSQSANLAKFWLQWRNIWDDGCHMDIQFSNPEKFKDKAEPEGMAVEIKDDDNADVMERNNHTTIETELK